MQFGFNELASGLILAKQIGSIFSRQRDADIFGLISECGVSVTSVPAWMKDFKLARSTKIHGNSMRIVQGPKAMKDVQVEDIEGFAAIVVLCTRYVETVESMVHLVQGLLTGGFATDSINKGDIKDAQANLFRNWTPLIRSWIQAVISTDAESEQAKTTKHYLAQLAQVGVTAKLSEGFSRSRLHNASIICDLLGGKEPSAHDGEEIRNSCGKIVKQRIFDTMSAGVASIGLAAAANGADVTVQCIDLKDGRERRRSLPFHRDAGHGPSQYLVRLWLYPPPIQIYGMPRSTTQESQGGRADASSGDDSIIIFGGDREIAMFAARELEFCNEKDKDMEEHILTLWKAGLSKGRSMTWTIKPPPDVIADDVQVTRSLKLYFKLQP